MILTPDEAHLFFESTEEARAFICNRIAYEVMHIRGMRLFFAHTHPHKDGRPSNPDKVEVETSVIFPYLWITVNEEIRLIDLTRLAADHGLDFALLTKQAILKQWPHAKITNRPETLGDVPSSTSEKNWFTQTMFRGHARPYAHNILFKVCVPPDPDANQQAA
jgi:hypothetical protein